MFDRVYKIAKESKSLEELKEKLGTLHIDAVTKKHGLFVTTAAKLAMEGNHEKVEWMRQLGASVHLIAQGYAFAHNHGKVEHYRVQHRANVNSIVLGFAVAEYHDSVNDYLKKYKASPVDIAIGYALAGADRYVEKYRREHQVSPNAIALGYAAAQNYMKVQEYSDRYKIDYNWIAQGYVVAGEEDRVDYYRRHHGAKVDEIVRFYALIGNDRMVELYRTQHKASINAIVEGYAGAGNHERVESYRKEHGASISAIVKGYRQYLSDEKLKKYDIEFILNDYLKNRKAVTDKSSRVTKEYFYGSFFSFFQKSFTQKKDAVRALKSALKGENVNLSAHLSTLRNGTLGQSLRDFIKAGMANELVGKKVNTVREFVQALQDKCANKTPDLQKIVNSR